MYEFLSLSEARFNRFLVGSDPRLAKSSRAKSGDIELVWVSTVTLAMCTMCLTALGEQCQMGSRFFEGTRTYKESGHDSCRDSYL